MSTTASTREPFATHEGVVGPHDRSVSSAADCYPTLITRRFAFRPFMLTDISALATLAGEHLIADTTIGVPHPYTMEFARMWITAHSAEWERGRALHWAALRVGEDRIAGYGGLNNIDMTRCQAELRFWVGNGVERKSDAIEWAAAIIGFAWRELNLSRVYALQLSRHPLAGRVLTAVGMQQEGVVRKRVYKEGPVEDILCWAIARSDSEREG